jgi:hypothetical protein
MAARTLHHDQIIAHSLSAAFFNLILECASALARWLTRVLFHLVRGASGGKLYLLVLRIKIDGEEFVASNKAARGIRARYFQISGD